jgi:hypothetical protein
LEKKADTEAVATVILKLPPGGGEIAASLRFSQRLLYSAVHYSHRFSIAV